MMNFTRLSSVPLLLAWSLLLHHNAVGQSQIPSSVFGSGGGVISGSGRSLIGTVGQPAIGVASNSAIVSQAGFWYGAGGLITGIEQISDKVPEEFRLEPNYPNPFNPSTTIEFAVPKHAPVTLTIFDLLGREVRVLVDGEMQPGEYKVTFDATGLSSGVYFYCLKAQGFVQVRKLTVLK